MILNTFRFLLFSAAALVGATLALHEQSESSAAGPERIRWLGAVGVNSEFCFGIDDWHQTWAGDIFADDASSCGDTNGSDNAYLFVRGFTADWELYYHPAGVYDGNGVSSNCYNVFADVYGWNPDGSNFYLGSEWYIHVYPQVFDSVEIWMGEDQWAASDPVFLGPTVGNQTNPQRKSTCGFQCGEMIPDCTHVHQTIWNEDGPLDVTENTSLDPDDVYDQFDIDNYIHHWDGWSY